MDKQEAIDKINEKYNEAVVALYSKSGRRAPYKRGPKSTETGPVVGVYEGISTGSDTMYVIPAKEAEKIFGKPAQPPIIAQRPNIPNRYDREALADFYEGKSLKRAQSHYDYLILRAGGVTEKEAFSATLFMYAPTI